MFRARLTLCWIAFFTDMISYPAIMISKGNNSLIITHISRQRGWPRGSGEPDPSPHSWIFTSVSVDSNPRSYLFTSDTVWVTVFTALKCGTEPIRQVKLHSRDRRGAAPLRCRNCTEIIVPMCEQNPYTVWIGISCQRNSFPVYREHTKPHTIMIIRLVLCSTNINFVLK